MNYDNPNSDIKYLKDLSPTDKDIYTRGYLRAYSHLLDAFTQTKIELLGILLTDPGTNDTDILNSNIGLIDYYEALVHTKVANIETTLPEEILK